jgi:hypothetical protein
MLTAESKARFDTQCEALVVPEPKQKKMKLTSKHTANLGKVRAFDKIMMASTSMNGATHFIDPGAAGPLTVGQTRFCVPVAELPVDLQMKTAGRVLRSCIEEPNTRHRLEVNWSANRPSVWQLSDMGSKGWYAKLALVYKLRARGSEIPCYAHRRVRNRELALVKASLSWVVQEWRIVLGWLGGPFGSEANYAQATESLLEFVTSFDYKNEWYRACYERVVLAKTGGHYPMGFGTEEHMIETFLELSDSPLFKTITANEKKNRWHAQAIKFRAVKKMVPSIFLSAGYMCITRGYMTPADLPGYRLDFKVKVAHRDLWSLLYVCMYLRMCVCLYVVSPERLQMLPLIQLPLCSQLLLLLKFVQSQMLSVSPLRSRISRSSNFARTRKTRRTS